jgi:hypothetical protein
VSTEILGGSVVKLAISSVFVIVPHLGDSVHSLSFRPPFVGIPQYLSKKRRCVISEAAAGCKSPPPLVASAIFPVNNTEVRIVVMVLEAHLMPSFGPQDDCVAHLSLVAIEPMGQHYSLPVLFAGYRVLDRLGLDVPHLLNVHRGAAALAVHREVDGGDAPPPTLTASGP